MSPTISTRTHRLFRNLTAVAFAGSAAMTLVACGSPGGWGGSPRYNEDRAMTVAHVSGTALRVVNANGSVAATGGDTMADEVRIEATIYSNDTERLAFATLRADRMGDGTLDVRVEWPAPGRQNNEGATIRIYLPEARGVDVRTSNGAIHAEYLGGQANLVSSNGKITIVGHRGAVYANSSNGAIRAEAVEGPVDLQTSNGSVVVEHGLGPILVETSNGSVSVQTADGNPGPVRVRTSNGRVDLDLGQGFDGVLKLGTSNAKINVRDVQQARLVESSKNYVELRIGESTEVSAVKTSNGSIRVKGTEPSVYEAD